MANSVADTSAVVPAIINQAALPVAAVALDGTNSTPGPGGAAIVTYLWTLVSGPAGHGASIDLPASATPNLINVDTWGDYLIFLKVTDDIGQVSITDLTDPAVKAAFALVKVRSTAAQIFKPAAWSRDYWQEIHDAIQAIDDLKSVVTALNLQDLADVTALTSIGPSLDHLMDALYATDTGLVGGTSLHKHKGPDVDAATAATQGAILLSETPADPANPAAVNQDRHNFTGFVDGTQFAAGYTPGVVGLPTASSNESLSCWHARSREAVQIEAFEVSMSDAGTIAGGGYTWVLYMLTAADFIANNWGAAVVVGTVALGAPAADHEPLHGEATALAFALAAGRILAVRPTVAPAVLADMGRGLSINVCARRLV